MEAGKQVPEIDMWNIRTEYVRAIAVHLLRLITRHTGIGKILIIGRRVHMYGRGPAGLLQMAIVLGPFMLVENE